MTTEDPGVSAHERPVMRLEPITPTQARWVAQVLQDAADDPMWNARAEVSKALLSRAASALWFMSAQVETLAELKLPASRDKEAIDEGKLWSFLRLVMSQGVDIFHDYNGGRHSCYEAYSARLDAAAAERAKELLGRLDPHNNKGEHHAD